MPNLFEDLRRERAATSNVAEKFWNLIWILRAAMSEKKHGGFCRRTNSRFWR